MAVYPSETLTAFIDSKYLCLVISQKKISQSGWPVYDLDVFINGQASYYYSDGPISPYLSVKLLKIALALLDDWCKRHPHSFLATYDGYIIQFYRFLEGWGVDCDLRCDTWFTCIDGNGQRVLYPGLLNLIPDCLDVCDLWRVAKDTNYFLGYLETPVDMVMHLFDSVGIERLIQPDFILTGNFQALFDHYQARLGDQRLPKQRLQQLKFTSHSLGSEPIYVSPFIPRDSNLVQDFRFYYGMRSIAALTPVTLALFSQLNVIDKNDVDEAEMKYLSQQLLALDPGLGELL